MKSLKLFWGIILFLTRNNCYVNKTITMYVWYLKYWVVMVCIQLCRQRSGEQSKRVVNQWTWLRSQCCWLLTDYKLLILDNRLQLLVIYNTCLRRIVVYTSQAHILPLPFTSCVTWSKLFNLSVLRVSYLQNRNNNSTALHSITRIKWINICAST